MKPTDPSQTNPNQTYPNSKANLMFQIILAFRFIEVLLWLEHSYPALPNSLKFGYSMFTPIVVMYIMKSRKIESFESLMTNIKCLNKYENELCIIEVKNNILNIRKTFAASAIFSAI